MALIGEIITKIKVDKTDVNKNLKATERAMLKFQQKSKKILSGLKVGVAALAAGFTGLAAAVVSTRDEIDRIGKVSEKLGIGVENLQALRFAAEQTGVEARTLDMALQRMVRRISEAAKGTGEAKDALKELGLDAQALAQMSPDKQFAKIADAMKKVQNQTDKVRLSFKLFDSEGVALVNTLNSDLKKTQEEFKELGIGLSTREVKNVEKFNDAVAKVKSVFTTLFQKIAAGVAGPLTELTNKFLAFLKAGGADAIKNSVVKGIDTLVSVFQALAVGIKTARTAFTDLFVFMSKQLDTLTNKISKFGNALSQIYGGMKMRMADAFEAIRGGFPAFGDAAGGRQLLSQMTRPTAMKPATNQAPVMRLEIATDADTLVKKMLQDRAAQDLVKTVLEKETAQIGK